ncbi:retrovirus-related pol polyprotein from transposon TNT 1-94 [Tanacetum coccineum]
MTGNRSQLMNFVSKFLGTVRFRNDQIARIMGYGDYQLGNVIISRVYYVEGLGHNLFSVGQFCDADLEVAFQKNTCFIRNLEGVDLLSGSRDTNLYTISLDDMLKSSPICLLSKASKTKSWLWHRRLSHLNFGTLNKLAKDGLARGIPRLKFLKDHLCSAYALGKSKKSSHQPKAEDTNQEKLYLLHMDLCGSMCVASIKIAGLRWIPTGKIFTDNTTKVDSVPPNGSNDDITNPYECDQTLNVSAGTTNLSAGPAPNLLTPGPISSGLVPNPAPAIPYVPPTNKELEMLFQPMFDEYFNPLGNRQDPIPNVVQDPVIPTGPLVSISIDLDAPSGSHISSPLDHHSSSVHHGVAGEQYAEVNSFAAADPEPFVNVFALDPTSEASSSGEIMMPELNQSTQPHEHIRK